MFGVGQKGMLIVVGVGIRLAGQCSLEARDWIKRADVVFCLVGNPIGERWLHNLNPRTVSLQKLYRSNLNRPAAYEAMVEAILAAVRAGKTVVAAFYGHPGVFVSPSHEAVRRAREEGYEARMLPGISAEACLFADCGVDPAEFGCQSYEARDFFLNTRIFDPTASLLLWQIAVLGDATFTAFESNPLWLDALAQALMETYPGDHTVIVYEAATLPTTEAKLQRIALRDLAHAAVTQNSTLYVPPIGVPKPSTGRLSLLS